LFLLFVTAIGCSALSTPANGNRVYSPDTLAPYDHGTVATLMCDTGYGAVGTTTRTCGGDGSSTTGSWTTADGSCGGTVALTLWI